MYAGKYSSRRMIYILFIGAITTLSITLTNAGKSMKCTDGFQASDGGWSTGTGLAGKHLIRNFLRLVLTVHNVSRNH
jgi:hypothetical protein